MDPPLADERDVAHDPRRGEPRQVAHDGVLQVLGLPDRQAPVLGVRDHVAHVEVVRHDPGVVQEREAQLQEIVRRGVHPAQQHALVPDVAVAPVEELRRGFGHQGRQLVRVVHVGVDRDGHPAFAGAGPDPGQPLLDVGL